MEKNLYLSPHLNKRSSHLQQKDVFINSRSVGKYKEML